MLSNPLQPVAAAFMPGLLKFFGVSSLASGGNPLLAWAAIAFYLLIVLLVALCLAYVAYRFYVGRTMNGIFDVPEAVAVRKSKRIFRVSAVLLFVVFLFMAQPMFSYFVSLGR
jgi:uncharacterized membrane protein YdbT with pleckstrin-like domain